VVNIESSFFQVQQPPAENRVDMPRGCATVKTFDGVQKKKKHSRVICLAPPADFGMSKFDLGEVDDFLTQNDICTAFVQ